jgi:ferredoxin
LQTCESCRQPVFRLRRRGGSVEVRSQAHFDRLDATFEPEYGRASLAAIATFTPEVPAAACRGDAAGAPCGSPAEPCTCGHDLPPGTVRASLRIDTRDCIGCDVCVAHCARGVLRMADGKALIDLTKVTHCDLDGACVDVCPTNVVTLSVEPAEPQVELTPAEAATLDEQDDDQDGDGRRPAAA